MSDAGRHHRAARAGKPPPDRGGGARTPLLMAAPADPGRESMTIRLSRDGGARAAGLRLPGAKAGHSGLVQLDGGHAGILYGTGTAPPYETIRSTPLPLGDIAP